MTQADHKFIAQRLANVYYSKGTVIQAIEEFAWWLKNMDSDFNEDEFIARAKLETHLFDPSLHGKGCIYCGAMSGVRCPKVPKP